METKKLRTECSCHPVALMIAAMVVPLGCLSRARTVSCLVLRRLKAGPSFLRFAVLFGGVVGARLLRMLLCDMTDPFGCDGTCAATAEAPQWRHRQRGGIREPIGPASHIDTTDALFAEEVQSFLQGNTRQPGSFAACHTVLTVIR